MNGVLSEVIADEVFRCIKDVLKDICSQKRPQVSTLSEQLVNEAEN